MVAALVVVLIFFVVIVLACRISVILSKTQCESKASMVGKVVIVTGANSGLGFETAKDLAARGSRVILACRSESRALAARKLIVEESGNEDVVYKHLDLGSLTSVRRFAEDIIKTEPRLDVLVNNAGVHGCGEYTADGIIEDMQINYFAAFLLTLLLLPLLKKTGRSRIVNLTSIIHFLGRVNLKYINVKGSYMEVWNYANNKLCMLLFTVELARRLKGTGVTANAVHPGIIMTNIVTNSDLKSRITFAISCWMAPRTVVEGAQTIIYLAVADEVANTSGKYFIDCKEQFMMSWTAYDKKLTADLWSYSEKLVGYENDSKKNNLLKEIKTPDCLKKCELKR